jgi:predicted dienelactone hydrolase
MIGATLALGLLASPLAAQDRVDGMRPDAPELAAFGTHGIGVRALQLTDRDRVDVLASTADALARGDRTLAVEIWYPAAPGATPGTTYETVLRDGVTPVVLSGRATRDAAPAADGPYPLVILSHGYPGNRFLLSHLGENLASKGYVAAAIDHTDSTYSDQAAFGSTLYNRPLDQRFVLDALADAGAVAPELAGVIDASRTAVVGYSMGGYGALILAGGGVTAAAVDLSYAPPRQLLAAHRAGSESLAALVDERVRAVIAIGPWGRNAGFWDAGGLAGIGKPLMLMAGSADDISRYDAIRQIFEETTGTTRHLLTFENANHNAAAPIPAPANSVAVSEKLGWAPFDHYADPVWDTLRMNNIAQHFATAFLDLHLKGIAERAGYLDLVPVASDGVWSVAEDGSRKPDHSYWAGFARRTAVGLRFETLSP